MGDFEKAASDFESARRIRPHDPNFSIDYKAIRHVDFIELDSDPDLTADFPTLADIGKLCGNDENEGNESIA